jgi:multiple antibiotic resistance protein
MDLVQATVALLAIADPVAVVPIFLSVTDRMSAVERRQAALRAAVAVFVILAVSVVGGDFILRTFGVSFPAFQAAGGLVIVLMGLEMLGGMPTRVQSDENPTGDQIVVPIAMPLIAGPGSITTVMTLTAQSGGLLSDLRVLVPVTITALLTYLALASSTWLGARFSARGKQILIRFMGLILVAIGAQLLLSGIKTFQAG